MGKETFYDNTGKVINRLNIKEDLHQDMKRRVISLPNKKYMLNSEKFDIPVIQKKNDTHEHYCWLLKEVRIQILNRILILMLMLM